MASQQRRCQSRAAGSQKTIPFISVPPSEATDGGVSMTEEEPVLTPAREEGTGHDEDRVGSRTLVSANTGYGFPVPQYCNYDGPPHVFQISEMGFVDSGAPRQSNKQKHSSLFVVGPAWI